MEAPASEAGDFLTAYGTTSVLVMPEKAKNCRTPKCISHMGLFAICEEVSYAGSYGRDHTG